MVVPSAKEVTRLLVDWGNGDQAALHKVDGEPLFVRVDSRCQFAWLSENLSLGETAS